MPRMTVGEYIAFQARGFKNRALNERTEIESDDESRLHEEIYAFLRQLGVRAIVHSRMDRATTQACGTSDFLFFWGRNAYAIEAKSKTGKLSPEQQGFLVAAEMDGWITGVVRSVEDLRKIVNP